MCPGTSRPRTSFDRVASVKTCVVVAKRGNAAASQLAQQLRDRYPELHFRAERALAQELGWELTASPEELADSAELVVVLGGDGTLIHAARLLRGRPVPVLGVNMGSLGFMTEVPASEAFPFMDEVLTGRFQVDSRMKLTCRLYRNDQLLLEDEVLNDVVINKGALARIADHECLIDGKYVTTLKADGMVIATPTGSTAYALAAGGPIVHPSTECIILAPICPHALTQRPLVIPSDRAVTLMLKSEVADVYLTFDGQTGHALQTHDRLEIRRSPNRVLLIRNPHVDYFEILRRKLKWGER